MIDRNGLVVAWAKSIAGNHNDLYQIEKQLHTMWARSRESSIPIEGLFLHADA